MGFVIELIAQLLWVFFEALIGLYSWKGLARIVAFIAVGFVLVYIGVNKWIWTVYIIGAIVALIVMNFREVDVDGEKQETEKKD